MNLRDALKEQYHAGLKMLDQCIERCPDELWIAGEHPRTFWRIAYHTVYFTHLYMAQDRSCFQPWEASDPLIATSVDIEPYEFPEGVPPIPREELRAYLAYVDALVDSTMETLDLDREDSGFSWYKNISKLSHELMTVRHLQGHVGQLSELLMALGIDINWVGRSDSIGP